MTQVEEINKSIEEVNGRIASLEMLLKGIENAEAPSSPLFNTASAERRHVEQALETAKHEAARLAMRLRDAVLQEERRASKAIRRDATLATLLAIFEEPYKATLYKNESGWGGPYIQLGGGASSTGRIEVELGTQDRISVSVGYGSGSTRRYALKPDGVFNSKGMGAFIAERYDASARQAEYRIAKEDRRTFAKGLALEFGGDAYNEVITVPLIDGGEVTLMATTNTGDATTFSVRETKHHGHLSLEAVRALLAGRTRVAEPEEGLTDSEPTASPSEGTADEAIVPADGSGVGQ